MKNINYWVKEFILPSHTITENNVWLQYICDYTLLLLDALLNKTKPLSKYKQSRGRNSKDGINKSLELYFHCYVVLSLR